MDNKQKKNTDILILIIFKICIFKDSDSTILFLKLDKIDSISFPSFLS